MRDIADARNAVVLEVQAGRSCLNNRTEMAKKFEKNDHSDRSMIYPESLEGETPKSCLEGQHDDSGFPIDPAPNLGVEASEQVVPPNN